MTIQILQTFVSWLCLQLSFSERWKKIHETFLTVFTFWEKSPFWKWMHISKKNYILKMNAHFEKEPILKINAHLEKELHFENECTFRKRTHSENECTFRKRTTFWKWECVFGKVKVINHFLKKLQLELSLGVRSTCTVQYEMVLSTKLPWNLHNKRKGKKEKGRGNLKQPFWSNDEVLVNYVNVTQSH